MGRVAELRLCCMVKIMARPFDLTPLQAHPAIIGGEPEIRKIYGNLGPCSQIECLELWIVSQPPGQRVEDVLAWAREIVRRYDDSISVAK